MQRNLPGRSAAEMCTDPGAWPALATPALMPLAAVSETALAKDRLARLARTIEADVIPRLVQAHRPGTVGHGAAALGSAEVPEFVHQLIHFSEARLAVTLEQLRARGITVEAIYLHLLAPAARRLGEMWEDDLCDFSTVTMALGRLQRLLRELSSAFGTEIGHPPNGRRALFVQPRDEQHSFGLSMVSEFFRRDGWDVVGGIAGAVIDPATKVRDEWFDVAGVSVGSELRLPWLRDCILALRAASCNADLRVMVGGPIFRLHPGWVHDVGADATADDAKDAPTIAERLLSGERSKRR